ncbi:MAG: COX15/CtaA family protein, partial [Prochlorococcaceae cyanobacterium]
MSISPHPPRQQPAPAALPSARFELLTSHLVVALVALVVIGGATRVMQAGLACPDWPLCYGQWLPGGRMNLQVFLEWFHRLDAFVVGVALLVLSVASWLGRSRLPGWLPWSAAAALLLVALQGALGALTVTQLLAPGLVTAHLGTALLLVAL